MYPLGVVIRLTSPGSRGSTLLWTVAAIAGATALLLEIALVLPRTFDDAFITFRYGLNLSSGFGLLWNPGEAPVEGFSSILGVIVSAASIAAGVYPLITAKLIGAASALTTLALILYLGNALRTRERLVAAALLLLSPDVAYHAISGMENAWVLPLVTYLVIRHLELESFSAKTFAFVGTILLLSCLLRPEGHLFAIVFGGLHAWRLCRGEVSGRSFWILAGPLLIGLTVLHVARFAWFGSLLPNTYYAKHTGGGLLETVLTGTLYLGERFVPVYGVLWVLAIWAALGRGTALSRVHLALLVAFPAYVLSVGGDDPTFGGARLLLPILPIIWIVAAQHATSVFRGWASTGAGLLAIAVLGAAVNAVWYFDTARGLYQLTALSTNIPSTIIAADTAHIRALLKPEWLPLSTYLAGVVAPNEHIALPWAGRVPFETRLPTIDLLGLNDRHIASQPKRQRGTDVKYDAEYVLARHPRVICDNFQLRGMQISDFGGMTDAQLHALGAIKIGQRELLRSPALASRYVVDPRAPSPGCFIRIGP